MKKHLIARQHVLEKIKQLYPGERIPSERELLQSLQFSRMTIRKAIDQLVQDGVLYRVNNSGTFVAKAGVKQYFEQVQVQAEATHQLSRRRDVHQVRRIKATEEVASALLVPIDHLVIQMQATTYEAEYPIAYEECYFHPEILKDVDLALLKLLGLNYLRDQLGLQMSTKVSLYKALLPLAIVQHHLQLAPNQPIMYIQTTTYLTDGRPVEYYKGYINDRYHHVVLMTRA
jgi:DNA-binding GntR family transcriptional regulator